MKEVKFYKVATITLIALNFLIVAFFIFNKPKHPGPGQPDDMKNRAVEMLHLDETQEAAFHELVELHKEEMESLNALQKQKLELFFEGISDDNNIVNEEAQLSEFGAIEMQKVESTFRHFESIKAILKPNQLNDFDQFMKLALNQILGGGGKQKQGPPPPRH